MKKLLTLAAILAVTLVSCQRKELDTPAGLSGDGSLIGFSTYNQRTKASVATDLTLKANGFGVFGVKNDTTDQGEPTVWDGRWEADFFEHQPEKVSYDIGLGKWSYSPTRSWPECDLVTLDFFAFSPYDQNVSYEPEDSSSALIGPFTVSDDISEQEDLLMAVKLNVPQLPSVMLEFQHALSRIGFSAYAPSLSSGQSITITEVQVRNTSTSDDDNPEPVFVMQGNVGILRDTTLAGYQLKWVPASGSTAAAAFRLYQSDFENDGQITDAPARLNKSDKYIMVMPQIEDVLPNVQIFIRYVVVKDDGSQEEKTKKFGLPAGVTFEPGKAYTFNFNLGVNDVVFDCAVEDWSESVVSLNASSKVTAGSSREDCDVFVDAQRKYLTDESGKHIVTYYNLFAERRKVRNERGDSVNVNPRWMVFNKWEAAARAGLAGLGELMDIYLGWIELCGTEPAIIDTTIQSKRYTVLSFYVNDANASLLEGHYYAQYEEDPIRAYVFDSDSTLKPNVQVNRKYYKYEPPQGAPEEADYWLPYTKYVTLSITKRPTEKFRTWQKYNDYEGVWEDITTQDKDPESAYKLGLGYSLSFVEVEYDASQQMTSREGKYRAVFNDDDGTANIHFDYRYGEDWNLVPKTRSTPQVADLSGDEWIDQGTSIQLQAGCLTSNYKYNWQLSTDGGGIWESRIDSLYPGTYTVTLDEQDNWSTLSFTLAKEMNGNYYRVDAYEENNPGYSWYGKTTTGKSCPTSKITVTEGDPIEHHMRVIIDTAMTNLLIYDSLSNHWRRIDTDSKEGLVPGTAWFEYGDNGRMYEVSQYRSLYTYGREYLLAIDDDTHKEPCFVLDYSGTATFQYNWLDPGKSPGTWNTLTPNTPLLYEGVEGIYIKCSADVIDYNFGDPYNSMVPDSVVHLTPEQMVKIQELGAVKMLNIIPRVK